MAGFAILALLALVAPLTVKKPPACPKQPIRPERPDGEEQPKSPERPTSKELPTLTMKNCVMRNEDGVRKEHAMANFDDTMGLAVRHQKMTQERKSELVDKI